MAKRDRPAQASKGRNTTRVNRVLDIRKSNASGFHGVAGYDRNGWRNDLQAGRYMDEDYEV